MFDTYELLPIIPNAPEWQQERMEHAIKRLYHLKKSLQLEPPKETTEPSHPKRRHGQSVPSWNAPDTLRQRQE